MKQAVAVHELEYSKGEVSTLVIKAYVVSLLLLLAVLLWSLSDAWVLYAQDVFNMPAYHNRHYTKSARAPSS